MSLDPTTEMLLAIEQAFQNQQLIKLIFSKYVGQEINLQRIDIKMVNLRAELQLSFLYHYKTQDVTKNYSFQEGLQQIEQLITQCKQANLFSTTQEIQLKKNKKKAILNMGKKQAVNTTQTVQAHDREKQRYVQQGNAFLKELGITDEKAQVIPSMARKWKQINKFIEIFASAYEQIDASQQELRIVDFGSGKGYLTFALYDYLQQQQKTPLITGVELRRNLVEFCQNVADKVHFNHLDFFEGDVRSYQPEKLDVMIALHACDIATDFAIHTGIRLNASMIMCAPCCHKELRPQLHSPEVLQPMLQFGIHAGQQAEMLTDTLRALLLKAYGYETKVFEFVSLEHTSKNKMILATKRKNVSQSDAKIMAQIQALKEMYGVKKQTLELLLQDQLPIENIGCKC